MMMMTKVSMMTTKGTSMRMTKGVRDDDKGYP